MCLPPITFMSVDLPAPLAPMSMHRAPLGNPSVMAASWSFCTSSVPWDARLTWAW